MCSMSLNPQLNGVELYFTGKPHASILDSLKAVGYRWHNFKKCWYAKQNSQTMELAKMLSDEEAEQSEVVKGVLAAIATNEEPPKLIYPNLDELGHAKINLDSNISIFSGLGPTCKTGYFADINAYVSIRDQGVTIVDLTNALQTGKSCKKVAICFPWSMMKDINAACFISNNCNVKTFKDAYTRYFIECETDGADRYEETLKSISTFSPFRQIKPIKTPTKWTLAHVWKAILSGQIYAGKVDGHYSDDYAYDAAVNFGTGRGIGLIKFASDIIEHPDGWYVRIDKQGDGKAVLSVNCHSFNCNTLYYDEACSIEEGARRREQARQDKEARNISMLAKVITLNPEDYSTDNIYSVEYLEMDDNTGTYSTKTETLQWHDIFWTDTIWEGNDEREVIENRLKVISIEVVAIEPHGIYCISNTFDRYTGEDERIIKSDCYMSYVTGHALYEILKEGKTVPMVRDNPISFNTLEKDLRMHFQTVYENGFACSKSTLFGVGAPVSFRDEHAKLLREWDRIPK